MTCYHGLQSYRRSVTRKQNRYENGLPLLVAYFHGSTSYLPYTKDAIYDRKKYRQMTKTKFLQGYAVNIIIKQIYMIFKGK